MLDENIVCPNCYFCSYFGELSDYTIDEEEYKATFHGTLSCPICSHSVGFWGWADFHEGQDMEYFNDYIMDFNQECIEDEKFLTQEEYLTKHHGMMKIDNFNIVNTFDVRVLRGLGEPYCIFGVKSEKGDVKFTALYTMPSWELLIRLKLHNLVELYDAERLKRPLTNQKKNAFLSTLESLSKKYSLKVPDNWLVYLSE